jgi:ABC-2 type transport system permease protein
MKVLVLAKRELTGYFLSPIGYLVIALYLVLMGALFGLLVFLPGQIADMRRLFEWSHIALIVAVPLITMSLLSEEYSSGRIEMLRTSPITELDIVLGKFLGAMGFFVALVASTLLFLFMLMIFGHPNYGAVEAGYLGLLLLGSLFVSIGLFFSSLTRHQVVAAMAAFMLLLVLGVFADALSFVLNNYTNWNNGFATGFKKTIAYLSFRGHMINFSKGLVDLNHVVYFVSGTLLFLFATYLVLESRKWR